MVEGLGAVVEDTGGMLLSLEGLDDGASDGESDGCKEDSWPGDDRVEDTECYSCKEGFIMLEDSGWTGHPSYSYRFNFCGSCIGSREKQEEWRERVAEEECATATETTHIEQKYLSDEAIENEKRIRGAPEEPDDTDTPLRNFRAEEMLRVDSFVYWPYGLSSIEYLRYINQKLFDNPTEETPSDE